MVDLSQSFFGTVYQAGYPIISPRSLHQKAPGETNADSTRRLSIDPHSKTGNGRGQVLGRGYRGDNIYIYQTPMGDHKTGRKQCISKSIFIFIYLDIIYIHTAHDIKPMGDHLAILGGALAFIGGYIYIYITIVFWGPYPSLWGPKKSYLYKQW